MLGKYSGKAKDILSLENGNVKLVFRDSISAFDGEKLDELKRKGEINCKISAQLFDILNNYGLETHYISKISDTELLCKHVDIIPVEVVCRNISAGSFCRRYGVERGIIFNSPLIEFFLKDDELHDPLVAKDVAVKLNWLSETEAELMEVITLAVNHILYEIFDLLSLRLVDFKLEFGRTKNGHLVIADEISADTMRLWEKETGEIKDKDRYRQNLGNVIENYADILNRLEKIQTLPELDFNTNVLVNIELKDSVLDPAGEVTFRSLVRQGYDSVELVRLGKNVKINLKQLPSFELLKIIEEISKKILSNPLIENFKINFMFKSNLEHEGINKIQQR